MKRVLFSSNYYLFFEAWGRFQEKTAIFLGGMIPYADYTYPQDECIRLVEVCGSFETHTNYLIDKELSLWNRTLKNLAPIYFLSLPRDLALVFIDSYYKQSASPIVNDRKYYFVKRAIYGFLDLYHTTNHNCYIVDLGDTILFRLRYYQNIKFFLKFRGFYISGKIKEKTFGISDIFMVKSYFFMRRAKNFLKSIIKV